MVRRQHQKGQGFTEFALILPLLLLLLLGVIEAGRVIWAYITVQNAAREATRYAVTGRPYLDSNTSIADQAKVCLGNPRNETGFDEPDPVTDLGIQPWLCSADDRVQGIKRVALDHLTNLAWSDICGDGFTSFPPPENEVNLYNPDLVRELSIQEYFGTCAQQPGAIGILVQGQVTTETTDGTLIVAPDPVMNHPGQQGLNIQVTTFYNLQMLTPIFDAIMGGTFVRLEGRTQLQNEGLDSASGIEPPPGINPPPTPDPSGGSGSFIPNARIWSVSGYNNIQQSDVLRVHLENHASSQKYNIYLADGSGTTYLICGDENPTANGVTTDAQNRTDVNCPLAPTGIPPGTYDLYSTVSPSTSPRVAAAPEPVQIVSGGDAQILVEGGNIWATNEATQISLLFHLITDGPFDVKLYDGAGVYVQDIATDHSGISTDNITWVPADLAALGQTVCDLASGVKCTIRSFKDNGDMAAEVKVNINQPEIILSGGLGPYARGQYVNIFLKSHTPGRRYSIKIPSSTGTILLDTLDTNASGDTTNPRVWIIDEDCGTGGGLPDGFYDLTSHPLGSTTNQIAILKNVEVKTPPDPFITVEGGTTWTIGSFINIKVHQHQVNQPHYLEFDGQRIPTESNDDTFITGSCGDRIVGYTIPLDKDAGTYTIASFDATNNAQQATLDITVLAKPVIQVLEGDKVFPDQTITIKLSSHVPNFSYDVFYAEKKLFSLFTDPDGSKTTSYSLTNLPVTPGPNFSNPANYGVPFDMWSQTVSGPIERVATTTLTIVPADLVVTQISVPATATISSTIPVQVVVQNVNPIAINKWVDIDLYFMKHPQPDPFGPSYLAGYNFPGDIKYWKNSFAPGEAYTITHMLPVESSGVQNVYGYADTSNFVFEDETPGEVANPNNIGSTTYLATCPGGVFEETFSPDDYAQGAALPGWSVARFGTATGGYGTQVTGNPANGILSVNSTGQSNWTNNDNGSGRGELYFHRTASIETSAGLDVHVKILDISGGGSSAKAGLQVRGDAADPLSAKVNIELLKNGTLRASYREYNGGMQIIGSDTSHSLSPGSPYWLRIERLAGANTFNFYIRQSAAAPPPADDPGYDAWWGAAVRTRTLSSFPDNVYVGVFNASYSSSSASTSQFDNFSVYPDPAGCPNPTETPDLPPGLQVCTELLVDRSFETSPPVDWGGLGTNGVSQDTSLKKTGNRSLRASTLSGAPQNPRFWQRFTMPDWILSSTTTLDVSFYRNVDNQGTNQPDDRFFAVVATAPNLASAITDPSLVGTGVGSSPADPNGWVAQTIRFNVAAGVNLEDYANQQLYLYFYNNSNNPAACGGFCATHYYFDDMSLQNCTTQPKPSPITTRINGSLTLNFSDGSVEKLPFVRVWAYAENDNTVYETYSIQGGQFNFYNLPATASGTQYTIFAQYYLVDPFNPSQIETLAADSSIILKSSNGDGNPATVALELFTLAPRP